MEQVEPVCTELRLMEKELQKDNLASAWDSEGHSSSSSPGAGKTWSLRHKDSKRSVLLVPETFISKLTTIINSFTAVSFIASPSGAPTCCCLSEPRGSKHAEASMAAGTGGWCCLMAAGRANRVPKSAVAAPLRPAETAGGQGTAPTVGPWTNIVSRKGYPPTLLFQRFSY